MKYWPLRLSVPLALLATTAFVILVNAGMEFHQERRDFFEDTENTSHLIGHRLTYTIEKRIRSNQPTEIDDELSQIAPVRTLKRASVTSPDGRILHSTDQRLIGQTIAALECQPSEAVKSQLGNRKTALLDRQATTLCTYYPVSLPGEHGELRSANSGLLILNFDLSTLQRELIWDTSVRASISAGITLAITFLLYLWLTRRLTSRLEHLALAAERHLLGTSAQDFQDEGDEIGKLGMQLLQLSQESTASRRELEQTAQRLRESEERLQLALQGTNEGLWDWDILTNTVFFSSRWKSMLGYTDAEIPPHVEEWSRRIHPDDIETTMADVKRHLAGETPKYESTHRVQHKDGHWVWILDRGEVVRNEQGNPVRMVGTHTDISERMQHEEERQLAASVFDNILDGLMITDATGKIVLVNRAFTEITGYAREEAIGNDPNMLQSGRHDGDFYAAMWNTLLKENAWQGELWNRRKDGEVYVSRQSISAIRDKYGKISHFIGLFNDISAYVNKLQKLERLTHYDALTGLPNRMLLADRLLQAMDRCRRQRDLLAVCFMDLDGFKPVNDRYGHAVGDQLLIEVSWRLNNMVRAGDTVARLGGDEFVLIIGGITDESELALALDRIIQAIAEPCTIEGAVVAVGSSIGITLYPRDDSDADTLINHADMAMYDAKAAGKGVWKIYQADATPATTAENTTASGQ